jgi:hypothetical protein
MAEVLGGLGFFQILKMAHIWRNAMPPVQGEERACQPRGAVGWQYLKG